MTEEQIFQRGEELFDGGNAFAEWLDADSRYLQEKPREAMRRGEYQKVLAALEALASGIYL